MPFSLETTHHEAALNREPTSTNTPEQTNAPTYPCSRTMIAPVIGVPCLPIRIVSATCRRTVEGEGDALTVRAVMEMTRNMVAVRCPTSPMFFVIEATVAGIIDTSAGRGSVSVKQGIRSSRGGSSQAPLPIPKSIEKTMTPAAVRHIGRKRKIRIPDKTQFGIKIVKGP